MVTCTTDRPAISVDTRRPFSGRQYVSSTETS